MRRLLLLLCLLCAQSASGAIAVVGTASVSAAIVPTFVLPTNQADDIIFLFIQSSNQTIATPSGYTEIDTQASMATGTPVTAGALRLAAFWKRSTGSETDPAIADSGDHTSLVCVVVRGAVATGTPYEAESAGLQTTTGTSVSWQSGGMSYTNGSSVSSLSNGALVLTAIAHAIDIGTNQLSTQTCATLNNVFEEIEGFSTQGTGGQVIVTSGIKPHAGAIVDSSTNNFTATLGTTSPYVMMVLAIKPVAGVPAYIGSGTFSGGLIAATPTLPTGVTTDDILLYIGQSSNQAIAAPTPPTGWTEIDAQASMATGTAAVAGALRLAIYWKRAGASESAPTFADSGDHNSAIILGFTGCITTGNPFDAETVGLQATTSTSVSWQSAGIAYGSNGSSLTTIANNALVLLVVGHAADVASTTVMSASTAAQLSSVVELQGTDGSIGGGTGGGFAVAAGNKLTAGNVVDSSTNNFTATLSNTSAYAIAAISLVPPVTATTSNAFFQLFVP